MPGLEGPSSRRGRPKIDKPEERYWWKHDLFAVDPEGREYCPHPTEDDDCWFFRRGPQAQVGHLGKTAGIRKMLHEIVNGKVDWVQFVIVGGECNSDCVNPRHSRAIDRATFMRMQSIKVAGMRANAKAPLLDYRFVDVVGDTVVVGVEAARLYWLLLAGKHMMSLWDWEDDIPAWDDEIWALKKPRNELITTGMVEMMRDEEWTSERVRKHASVKASDEQKAAALAEWTDFHEGLRTFAL